MIEDILQLLERWNPQEKNDDLKVDNILCGTTYYRKTQFDKTLSDLYYFLVILGSSDAGFSYFNEEINNHAELERAINVNAITFARSVTNNPLRIALIDAICDLYNKEHNRLPDKIYKKTGTYNIKADFRSQLVCSFIPKKSRVLLVGMVSEFVRDLRTNDVDLHISDLSPQLQGESVLGIPISTDGNSKTLSLLGEVDFAIVSGATMSSETIDSIFDVARQKNTKLIFYLETGSSLAPFLIDKGAYSVIAEKFPFYDLPGETVFNVYER